MPNSPGATVVPVLPRVLVVGDGEAARQTAELIARRQPVTLIIPQERLSSPAGLVSHNNISVCNGARILSVRGQWGNFTVTVKTEGSEQQVTAGAIVLAMEPVPGRLNRDCLLPAGERVWPLSRFSPQAIPNYVCSVSFLVGAGENDWALTFIPALRAAVELVERGIDVNFFFREYRVSAPGLEELCHRARQAGVNMYRYQEPPSGRVLPEGVALVYRDPFLTEEFPVLQVVSDLLVVAEEYALPQEAMMLAELLGLARGASERLQPTNVHYWPVKSSRPGVYLVGSCRDLALAGEAWLDAAVVASEVSRLAGGRMEVEAGYAVVEPARCALCLTCYRVCPYRAVEIKGQPQNRTYGAAAWIHPLACQRCGLCAAECPSAAITLGLSNAEKWAESQEIRFGSSEPGEASAVCLQVFACANSSWLLTRDVGRSLESKLAHLAGQDQIIVQRVPCAGQVGEPEVLSALLHGADGVLVLPCYDQNCRHRRGNRRWHQRGDNVSRFLSDVGLEPERLHWRPLSASSHQLVVTVNEMLERLRALGPWHKGRSTG